MLLYLFLGFLLMVALIGVMVAFTRAEPASLARALRWTAVGLAGAGVLLLPFIGRGSLIAFGPAILLPLITRLVVQRSRQWSSAGPQAGQSSTVETAWLAMTLDHDSGAMAGRVRAGRFAGRPLSELDLPNLLVLLDDCRAADPDAVALLEAYLDRTHGSSWRDPASGAGAGASSGTGPGAPAGGGMTRQEAYEILGLAEGASTQDIKDAHRRLMQNLHPDRGGSTYLAAKINQAKDLLLGN